MQELRISIVQTNIVWENKQENLRLLRDKLQMLHGTTEIVVLPEMFSTGFSMNSRKLAEPISGETIQTLKNWAGEFQFAITGSFICSEQGSYYNRAFFITPEGEEYYYDKRHLFRMGQEAEHFSSGDSKLIISYREWNICLLVCYDLRFPEIFQLAMRALGKQTPETCVVFEDSRNGLLAGANGGFPVIVVPDLFDPTLELPGLCYAKCARLDEAIDVIQNS